jgi:hypothetical protein
MNWRRLGKWLGANEEEHKRKESIKMNDWIKKLVDDARKQEIEDQKRKERMLQEDKTI